MNLYQAISKRKSCRAFSEKPLHQAKLREIGEVIEDFMTLYPDVTLKWRLAEKMKGPFKVKAPHYLIISGQGKAGEAESAGFIFQQLFLWFNLNGIGSVWLGGPKDVNKTNEDIVAMAFGEPKETIERTLSEFKRKPIEGITNSPDDPLIRAVHLAPSGINLQPWYLEKTDNKVLLYEKLLKPPISLMYKLTEVDMGIALCHYALACKEYNKPFNFKRSDEKGEKKGYKLFGKLS